MATGGLMRKNGLLLFWGQWPSNWEMSPFTIDDIEYNCVEQWMMAEKARMFGDLEVLAKILASPYPKAQKEFGRKVRGYDDAKWASERYEIVCRGVLEKYRQNDRLRELILSTNDADEFVEASPEDRIWGIGLRKADFRAWDKSTWRGENLLGLATTRARTILRGDTAVKLSKLREEAIRPPFIR